MTDLEKIKEFVMHNKVSESEKKFLVDYMAQMSKCSEAPTETNLFSVINDLKTLNDYLDGSADTSLVKDRINKELSIVSSLASGLNDEEKLIAASYALERLYYESDLPFRNTDAVLRKVEKNISSVRGKQYDRSRSETNF